jgi:multiple antibiotic resistance protein
MEREALTAFFISLLAISNPLGNLVIFLSLAQGRPTKELRKLGAKIAISYFVVALVTLWFGPKILGLFGISLSAFEVAGGLIVLTIGFSMLHGKDNKSHGGEEDHKEHKDKEDISVVPMTIPIFGGPGAMTAIIVNSRKLESFSDKLELGVACGLVALIIFFVLYFSSTVIKVLGDAGIKILGRVMGLILVAIAVSMIVSGLKEIFPVLVS